MGIVGLGANAGIIGHSLPSILVREALDPGPERLFEGRLIEAAGFAKDDREASQPRWIGLVGAGPAQKFAVDLQVVPRSEERRVGKEGASTCRSRWSRDHSKKKKNNK